MCTGSNFAEMNPVEILFGVLVFIAGALLVLAQFRFLIRLLFRRQDLSSQTSERTDDNRPLVLAEVPKETASLSAAEEAHRAELERVLNRENMQALLAAINETAMRPRPSYQDSIRMKLASNLTPIEVKALETHLKQEHWMVSYCSGGHIFNHSPLLVLYPPTRWYPPAV